MDSKGILALGIAAALAPAIQNASMQDEQPPCIAAIPTTAHGLSACPDKDPRQLHVPDNEPAIANAAVGAANAIRQIMATPAQFPAAYYEESFIWPQRGNLLITTPFEGTGAPT